MKEFMTKIVNVWKAWSIRTKSVVVVTLALIIFVVAGVFSTSPTPSPRFSVPFNIEKNIHAGGAYHLVCQGFSTPKNEQTDKMVVDFKYADYREAFLPASITKLDSRYQLAALDIAIDKNLTILQTYQVEDLHYKVMQLNKALYEVFPKHDLKNHNIDGYMVSLRGNTFSTIISYEDRCAMIIDYDYIKDAYVGVDIRLKDKEVLNYTEKQNIMKHLNATLDKTNK